MTARFYRPQHAVIFRAVHLTPALLAALDLHGITLDMAFAEINNVNTLRLDLAETARPR
jgi:hypothetical protein